MFLLSVGNSPRRAGGNVFASLVVLRPVEYCLAGLPPAPVLILPPVRSRDAASAAVDDPHSSMCN